MKQWLLGIAGIITGLVLFSGVASAAPPDVQITQGVVASSPAATFAPATVGPVSFAVSGACPRWSGTINTTNLAAQPINSNVSASQFDAGDIVTFAVVLRNTSVDGNAFDVALQNTIPDGFEVLGSGSQGANLCVTRGNNTSLAFTTNGAGFFGPTEDDNIELNDTVSGSLAPTHPTNGTDIVVITFDLRVAASHVPSSTQASTAQLLFYSASEGGALIEGLSDDATVMLGTFGRSKSLIATNRAFSSGNSVVVGEIVTYQLTVQVPQGQVNSVSVVDTMTAGLVFLSCDSITNDDPSLLSTSLTGGFNAACDDPTNPSITSDGRIATFTLGNLTNTDRTDGQAETITIVYRALVANVPEAFSGTTLNNSAVVRWINDRSAASESAPVVVRDAIPTVTSAIAPATALKAGDIVTVTIVIGHDASSAVPAFDMAMSQQLPAGLVPIAGSLDCSAGAVDPDDCELNGQVVQASWDELLTTETSSITLQAVVADGFAGQSLQAPLSLLWSSLPGDITTPQSPYSSVSTERTGDVGDPGAAANSFRITRTPTATLAAAPAAPVVPVASGNMSGSARGRLANTGHSMLPVSIAAVLLIVVALSLMVRRKHYSR